MPLADVAWLIAGSFAALLAALRLRLGRRASAGILAAVCCAGALVYLREARPPPNDPFVEFDGRQVTLTGVV
ncbi:MAG TPA: hypothetical protein VNN19_06205, partial [bacterium]|nr:hypothetical protein [bacterium]